MVHSVRLFHRKAMKYVDDANVARREGDTDAERVNLRYALEFEEQAANRTPASLGCAVLYRSAATIALRLGDFDKARELAQRGLNVCSYAEITAELQDILKNTVTGGVV